MTTTAAAAATAKKNNNNNNYNYNIIIKIRIQTKKEPEGKTRKCEKGQVTAPDTCQGRSPHSDTVHKTVLGSKAMMLPEERKTSGRNSYNNLRSHD